jgi:hypothetical protein
MTVIAIVVAHLALAVAAWNYVRLRACRVELTEAEADVDHQHEISLKAVYELKDKLAAAERACDANGRRIVELEKLCADIKGRRIIDDRRIGELKGVLEDKQRAYDGLATKQAVALEMLADVLTENGYKVER